MATPYIIKQINKENICGWTKERKVYFNTSSYTAHVYNLLCNEPSEVTNWMPHFWLYSKFPRRGYKLITVLRAEIK